MYREAIIAQMPAYRGRQILINDKQDTGDIIDAILRKHDRTKNYYDRICLNFWTGDPVTTAQKLFSFLKGNVNYKIEGLSKQTVKSPQAILYEGKGDCKHYASFINGVFDALKRKGLPNETCYRFCSYSNDDRPKHVFAVLTVNGREYFIDPVLSSFDKRRPMYKYKEDYATTGEQKKEQIGALYDISGVRPMHWTDEVYGNGQVGFLKGVRKFVQKNVIDATKTNLANAVKPIKKVAHGMEVNTANAGKFVQQNIQSVKKDIKQVAHGMKVNTDNAGKFIQHNVIDATKTNLANVPKFAKQVFGAVPRNSFLGMLRLNVFHLASQMWQKAASNTKSANWNTLAMKWQSMGGNPNSLYSAIVAGKNLYNRKHPNSSVGAFYYSPERYIQGIGVIDPGTATLIASAAPIMIALALLLQKMGIVKKENWDQDDALAAAAAASSTVPNFFSSSEPNAQTVTDDFGSWLQNNPNYSGYYGDSQSPAYYDQSGNYSDNIDPATGLPYGIDPATGLPYKQTGMFDDITTWVKDFYYQNKKPILLVGGTIAAIKIAPYIFNKKKTRRR